MAKKKTVSKPKKTRPFGANQRKAHLNMLRRSLKRPWSVVLMDFSSNFDYGMKKWSWRGFLSGTPGLWRLCGDYP